MWDAFIRFVTFILDLKHAHGICPEETELDVVLFCLEHDADDALYALDMDHVWQVLTSFNVMALRKSHLEAQLLVWYSVQAFYL